jgi:hypothetical protein
MSQSELPKRRIETAKQVVTTETFSKRPSGHKNRQDVRGKNPGIRHYPLGGDDVNPNLRIDSSVRNNYTRFSSHKVPARQAEMQVGGVGAVIHEHREDS